jgi:hypothetical protein
MPRNRGSTTSGSWAIKDIEMAAQRASALRPLTPYQQICNAWPNQQLKCLRLNPLRYTLGLNN